MILACFPALRCAWKKQGLAVFPQFLISYYDIISPVTGIASVSCKNGIDMQEARVYLLALPFKKELFGAMTKRT